MFTRQIWFNLRLEKDILESRHSPFVLPDLEIGGNSVSSVFILNDYVSLL